MLFRKIPQCLFYLRMPVLQLETKKKQVCFHCRYSNRLVIKESSATVFEGLTEKKTTIPCVCLRLPREPSLGQPMTLRLCTLSSKHFDAGSETPEQGYSQPAVNIHSPTNPRWSWFLDSNPSPAPGSCEWYFSLSGRV